MQCTTYVDEENKNTVPLLNETNCVIARVRMKKYKKGRKKEGCYCFKKMVINYDDDDDDYDGNKMMMVIIVIIMMMKIVIK